MGLNKQIKKVLLYLQENLQRSGYNTLLSFASQECFHLLHKQWKAPVYFLKKGTFCKLEWNYQAKLAKIGRLKLPAFFEKPELHLENPELYPENPELYPENPESCQKTGIAT